jgi:hypothetical protein
MNIPGFTAEASVGVNAYRMTGRDTAEAVVIATFPVVVGIAFPSKRCLQSPVHQH